jgi:predicted  nucleic acid-binding Zn-ribbon protein
MAECPECGTQVRFYVPEDIMALEEAERERDRYVRALTPSAETKGAYRGEFAWHEEQCDEDGEIYSVTVYVPWTVVKDIMKAIRKAATA